MRLLVGVVVTLLCVQTIQAATPRPRLECEKTFSHSKANIKGFFRSIFKHEHDIAHEYLLTIQGICDELTKILKSFAGTAPTECQIDEFFKAFWPMHLKAVKATTELRYYCDVLLQLSNKFVLKQKEVCNTDLDGTGCKVDTNKLYCDLYEFNDGLIDMAASAKEYLDQLLVSCDDLYGLAYGFYSENKPSCNKKGGDVADNFRNSFLSTFTDRHDIAHNEEFIKVKEICDQLTQVLDTWISRK